MTRGPTDISSMLRRPAAPEAAIWASSEDPEEAAAPPPLLLRLLEPPPESDGFSDGESPPPDDESDPDPEEVGSVVTAFDVGGAKPIAPRSIARIAIGAPRWTAIIT